MRDPTKEQEFEPKIVEDDRVAGKPLIGMAGPASLWTFGPRHKSSAHPQTIPINTVNYV
jgi:hypothetical protein